MSHSDDEQVLPLAAGEHSPVPGAVKIASQDMAGRSHTTRTKARLAALDILFEADLLESDLLDSLTRRMDDPEITVREFTQQIVAGVRDYQRDIDARINSASARDWPIERMPRIDRNIARIAVWELDHTDTDLKVIISEALEMAAELSTDDSEKFLNGLLASAADHRNARPPEEEDQDEY